MQRPGRLHLQGQSGGGAVAGRRHHPWGLGPCGLGRFWGWDAKEVWALISLLVYLAFLHGRYAAWIGTLAWPPASVAGATAITMAWYGVNYYLRTGLHSYALGAGGQMEVGLFLLGNWIFLLAALARLSVRDQLKEGSGQ